MMKTEVSYKLAFVVCGSLLDKPGRKRLLCIMTFEEFKSTLSQTSPPSAASPIIKALWYDGKGDWETAHNIAQDILSREGSLIHAYLHRKEGDNGNAAYWYQRAGRRVATGDLQQEWQDLVIEFLA